MKVLSPKQQRIIDFVNRFWEETGYPPTVRDIVSGCQISSTSVVDYNLDILEKKGYIELLSRSLVPRHSLQVPIIGQIAAGEPIPVPASDT